MDPRNKNEPGQRRKNQKHQHLKKKWKKGAWTYIGKIVRQQQDSLPKKLLGSSLQCPRKHGHPQKSSRSLYVAMLRSVLPGQISPKGKFSHIFEEYTYKLKSQTENEIRDITDQNDQDDELNED